MVETDGRISFANPMAARFLGFESVEALCAMTAKQMLESFQVLDAQGEAVPDQALPSRAALQGARPTAQLLRFRVRSSGEERWSLVSATPVLDEDGRVTRVFNLFRDVTEQKRSEQALRFLSEASSMLGASLDYDTTLAAVARAMVPELADWSAVELLEDDGKTSRQVALAHIDPLKIKFAEELRQRYPTDPDAPMGVPNVLRTGTAEMMSEIPQEVLEQGAVDEEHLRIINELGLQSYMVVPLKARGRILGAISLVMAESRRRFGPRDLELAEAVAHRAGLAVDNARLFKEADMARRLAAELAQRRAADELRARLARYASLRADVSVALSMPDAPEATLQRCAEAVVHHLGAALVRVWTLDKASDALVLQASAGLSTHLDGPHGRIAVGAFEIGRIALEKKPHVSNAVLDDPHVSDKEWARREAIVSFAGYPLVVGERVLGVLAAFSRERLADDTLNALGAVTDAIAQGLERRRAELAREEQARELARSNADLQQFAYVASHDLQEPLRMVASYTQLLARRYKGKLDADADEFIRFAVDGATRMQTLINDLLSYSRMASNKAEASAASCERALERALANLRAAIDEAGATVTHDPLPVVHGEENQLTQLFQNLVGNALKFRRSEAPEVRVTAERTGSEWTISVADNGIGIAPEYRERVFVIFQRLHPRTDYPGNGMGLAICKKIVERHGGRIWVHSPPGEGTIFRFTLPAQRRHD